MKYLMEVYRYPNGIPMKDKNGKMRFITRKNEKGVTEYLIFNSQRTRSEWKSKKEILRKQKSFLNLGVSGDNIYPVLSEDDKKNIEKIKDAEKVHNRNPDDVAYVVETETINGQQVFKEFKFENYNDGETFFVVHGINKENGKCVMELQFTDEVNIKQNIDVVANVGIDDNGNIFPQKSSQKEIQDIESQVKSGYNYGINNFDPKTIDFSTVNGKGRKNTDFEVLVNVRTGKKYYSARAKVNNSKLQCVYFLMPIEKAASYVADVRKAI